MAVEILFVVFCISSFVQISFYALSLFKLTRYRKREHILDFEDKPASIIVCAHNELENLKRLLPILLAQAYVNFEVVVVDDRSTDGSFEYLLEAKHKYDNLKVVRIDWTPEHVNAKKYALTLGIKGAQHEILVITDADCEPVSHNWLQQMASQFNGDTDFVLGFSYYLKNPGFLNLFIRYETLHTAILYMTMAMLGMPYMGVGRNIGYKRSFFLSRKGFNKFLKITGGDDDLFVNRYSTSRNTMVVLHPESVIMSEPKKNISDYVIQKIRHLSVGKMYRFKYKFLIGIFSLGKIFSWIFGLLLMILNFQFFWVLPLFLVHLLLLYWAYDRFTKTLRIKYESWALWFMDFVYISYLIVFSFRAYTAKKIKWS